MVSIILQRFLQQSFAFQTPRLLAADLYGQVQFIFKFITLVISSIALLQLHLGLCLGVDSNGPRVQHGLAIGEHGIGTGVGGTPYDGLYGEAPPERGIFFRLQVYERVGISLDEVYERASARIAALAASLAVLNEKRTKL